MGLAWTREALIVTAPWRVPLARLHRNRSCNFALVGVASGVWVLGARAARRAATEFRRARQKGKGAKRSEQRVRTDCWRFRERESLVWGVFWTRVTYLPGRCIVSAQSRVFLVLCSGAQNLACSPWQQIRIYVENTRAKYFWMYIGQLDAEVWCSDGNPENCPIELPNTTMKCEAYEGCAFEVPEVVDAERDLGAAALHGEMHTGRWRDMRVEAIGESGSPKEQKPALLLAE